MKSNKQLNILITGAASGIGKAIMNKYLANHHKVFAIDLNEISENENLISYQADITKKEQLNEIKNNLNNIQFDLIINVAGIHKMASLVEDDSEIIKKLIDINLYGSMLVNNIFYQHLKKNGTIIIITSEVAYLDPMPFNGLYNISKTALDSYSQALRQELNLIGQKVITFRPGAILTPLSNNSITDTINLANETILYQKQANNFSKLMLKFMGKPLKPEKLADKIYKVSLKKNPKYIYKIHQNFGLVFLNLLPLRMQCFIIKKLLNKGTKK